MIPTPRTPTPFKNALAAQIKMHGPLKMEVRSLLFFLPLYTVYGLQLYLRCLFCLFLIQPQPLAFLEEDIREVLKQETGADIFNRADIQQDYRIWKHNVCVVSLCYHTKQTPILMNKFKEEHSKEKSVVYPSWGFAVICILALWFQVDGPARKVRKSLVLDPWIPKDCLNVQLFQDQLNNSQVSYSKKTC